MTEQITKSGVSRDCPECSDKGVINTPCVLCNGTGRAQIYGLCPDCEEPTYDYGESVWCLSCDLMVAATGCRVGSCELNSRNLREAQ